MLWRWRTRLPSSSRKCSIGDRSGDNAGQGRTRMWFWFRKFWQTRATWHLALLRWKTWSKFRCCKKGRTIGSRISSLYFTVFNVHWTILSWVQPSWKIPPQTITLPPPKRSDSHTHCMVRKTFPTRDSSLKRMCCQVWSLQRRHVRQASLAVLMVLFKDWSYHRTPRLESRFT